MPSTGVEIAEGVKDALNTATFIHPTDPAERAYVPIYALEEMSPDVAKITVMPAAYSEDVEDRGDNRYVWQIDVAVTQQADSGDIDKLDKLMELVDEIQSFLQTRTLGMPSGEWMPGVVSDPIYDGDKLDKKKVFLSVSTFTYNGTRDTT